jgi:beta-lactamase class A
MRFAVTASVARMMTLASRRQLLLGTFGVLASGCAGSSSAKPAASTPAFARDATRALAEVERRVGGRVGLFALDAGSGRSLGQRPDERFAMCSTFKWVLAAAVLASAERRELSLDQRLSFGPSDLQEHAPFTRAHAFEGSATIEDLAFAAVTVSDNTATNLLLAKIGGPSGLTRFVRAQGDDVTRLDRDEPSMNDHAPGDPRDTTSPRAMASLLGRVVLGDGLPPASRARLAAWLRACETGKDRLRAGLPPGWVLGHKTGTGPRGATGDVAVVWPPARAPLIIASYLSDSVADATSLARAHADIARIVAAHL